MWNTIGINAQAVAVLAYLLGDGSKDAAWAPADAYEAGEGYLIDLTVRPWYNGRERGFSLMFDGHYQDRYLYVAVFEHRNSDEICGWAWTSELRTVNPPTVDDVPDEVAPDKNTHSFAFPYGDADMAAMWIRDAVARWWTEHRRP